MCTDGCVTITKERKSLWRFTGITLDCLADRANQTVICRESTHEIADGFIESVIICDPKHIEVIFTFDAPLQTAENKVTDI